MKSYKEISEDIRSSLSSEITGTPLDTLVGILSMYVYNIQANAISQLLEGNLDTAVSINSIILKGAQYGVSLPRVTNPEVEFQVKSVGSSHILYPGDEVISIGKFKFLYIGYHDGDAFIEDKCTLNAQSGTLVRCLIADNVTILNTESSSGIIYDESISHIASKIFVYRGDVSLNVYNSYRDVLIDPGINKVLSVTYPDYGVKITDFNTGDQASYKVILPGELPSILEVLNIIKGKASSKYVTVSATREGSNEQNIKLTNLGSEVLGKDDAVAYVENNLKLTQLIKSNTDINAVFEEYLKSPSALGARYKVSFILGNYLDIYINENGYIVSPATLSTLSTSEFNDRIYLNTNGVRFNLGIKLIADIKLGLNNPVSDELDQKVRGFISEYDDKFNTLIDEYDLITQINSINPLIRLTEFSVEYYAEILWVSADQSEHIIIRLVDSGWTYDVPNLRFTTKPQSYTTGNTYKMYLGKDKYLKTNLTWI